MLRKKLFHWIIGRFAPVAPVAPVVPEPQSHFFPRPALEPKQPVRPMSAVEILQNEPNLTPAELAERAGVTLSYARSLVRRRQTRTAVPVVWPIAPRIPASSSQTAAASRTQVIERTAAGVSITSICEDLGMPKGEAEFILKVDRLKKNLKD
jgi:hypothetical protein